MALRYSWSCFTYPKKKAQRSLGYMFQLLRTLSIHHVSNAAFFHMALQRDG